MPNRELLESYPLYRKIPAETNVVLASLPEVSVKMRCPECESDQTFTMQGGYAPNLGLREGSTAAGEVGRLKYLCQSCRSFLRYFLVRFGPDGHLEKVGQFPAPDVTCDPEIERLLGDNAVFYKRGLRSEAHGFGIGAFAYYRRIVEEIIDDLLEQVGDLIPEDDDAANYREAVERAKKTHVAADKIAIVKDNASGHPAPGGREPSGHAAHGPERRACTTSPTTIA